MRARPAREIPWKLLEHATKDFPVVVSTLVEAEEIAVFVWGDEIKGTIEAWVSRRSHVHVLEQREQSVAVLSVACHPAIKVKPLNNLVAVAGLVKCVNLGTTSGSDEHISQRRAQVP